MLRHHMGRLDAYRHEQPDLPAQGLQTASIQAVEIEDTQTPPIAVSGRKGLGQLFIGRPAFAQDQGDAGASLDGYPQVQA